MTSYPGFAIARLAAVAIGTRDAIPVGMNALVYTADVRSVDDRSNDRKSCVVSARSIAGRDQQLALTAEQVAIVDEKVANAPAVLDEEALMSMPLFDAKQLVAAEFERRYLIRVMERAAGSVSKGAALCNIDRTNFRRLLQRHGLR